MSITFGNDLGGVLIGVFLFVIGYVCCFRKKAYPVYKLFLLLLLFIYITMVIGVTLTPFPLDEAALSSARAVNEYAGFSDYLNLIPFYHIRYAYEQFLLNIILFVPFGILWSLYQGKIRLKTALSSGFIFSLLIETVQLGLSCLFQVPEWYFDVNDLIANILGAAIGYIVVKLVIVPAISAVLASRSKKKDQEDASSRKDRNGRGTQGK